MLGECRLGIRYVGNVRLCLDSDSDGTGHVNQVSTWATRLGRNARFAPVVLLAFCRRGVVFFSFFLSYAVTVCSFDLIDPEMTNFLPLFRNKIFSLVNRLSPLLEEYQPAERTQSWLSFKGLVDWSLAA